MYTRFLSISFLFLLSPSLARPHAVPVQALAAREHATELGSGPSYTAPPGPSYSTPPSYTQDSSTTSTTSSSTQESLTTSTTPTTTPTPACDYNNPVGLVNPKDGQIVYYNESAGYAEFEILYCSGQYFKTSSLYGDVWLTDPGNTSGEILALQQKPDDKDAGISSSYRFTVQVYPEDGDFDTGNQTVTFYEVATGYYDAYNYFTYSATITFAQEPAEELTPKANVG